MEDILSLLQDFDVANFLPEPDKYLKSLEGWIRLIVLAGPLVLLALGLWYYFAPPKEANHSVGFRTYWGMGSVEAWRFAQRLAGMGYMVLGAGLTVIMALVSISFRGENALAMVNTAIVCVIIEFILTLLLWAGINVLIYRAYDKDGNRRRKR